MNLFLILLAGGKGTRFGGDYPKQFLKLDGTPLALHSFDTLSSLSEVKGVCIVCAEEFQSTFTLSSKPLIFAAPGERRQDSLLSALQSLPQDVDWLLIHDACRPFIFAEDVHKLIRETPPFHASALGTPVISTIKVVGEKGKVLATPDRSTLWKIQTPQLVRRDVLEKGFSIALKKGLTVTDDVSLAELAGEEAKIVQGSPSNFKVTLPHDFTVAEMMLAGSA